MTKTFAQKLAELSKKLYPEYERLCITNDNLDILTPDEIDERFDSF